MKKFLMVALIWSAIWTGFLVSAIDEFRHWPELSRHLKISLVQFTVFIPIAWSIGLGKLWLILKG